MENHHLRDLTKCLVKYVRHTLETDTGEDTGGDTGGDTVTPIPGVLLMTIANNNGYGAMGGSRMILAEMDDVKSLPQIITDNNFQINSATNTLTPSNALQLTYAALDLKHEYRQSYAASDPSSLQYTTLDCSKDVTITNTVNLSLTRPGVVTTIYLVPMNYNTGGVVTGSNNSNPYQGANYTDKAFKDLADALQGTDGVVPDNLIAEYGMGYNDAQSLGLGPSIEIDLFELTPCAMATTLHGAEFDASGNIVNTDTNGVFCNVHGSNGNTIYNPGIDNAAQSTYQFPTADTKYVTYTYINNGVAGLSTDLNKYGPGDDFGINTLKNIEITNTIKGYASSDMPSIVELATGQTTDDYSVAQGWMQMTTTLTQGASTISMTVLSQGFPPNSGVEKLNCVISLWMRDNNYWLDGQEPDSNGNGTGIVRGWVNYAATSTPGNSNGSTVNTEVRSHIISDDTYNSLPKVYTTTDGYSSIATEGEPDLSIINPSMCLFGDMSITSGSETGKTYAVSMDVAFRGIDDTKFTNTEWGGQYAMSYGVYYASDISMDIFDENALTELVNVPAVVNPDETTANNYFAALEQNPWVPAGSFVYSPDPGSYITNDTTQTLPNAISGTGEFNIPSNQPAYMVFGGVITYSQVNLAGQVGRSTDPSSPLFRPVLTSYTAEVPDFLSVVMPADGANYLVFK